MESSQFQQAQVQLCPKCNGEGRLPNDVVTSSVFKVCDVCWGAKAFNIPVQHREITDEILSFVEYFNDNFFKGANGYTKKGWGGYSSYGDGTIRFILKEWMRSQLSTPKNDKQ